MLKYSEMDDRSLVDLLISEDSKAWDYFILNIIAPLCRTRKHMEMCSKNSISTNSLITQVWMILHKNNYQRLRNFAFRASLRTYLTFIVREAQRKELQEKIGKVPLVLSEDDTYCSLIISRETSDSSEIKDEVSLANEMLAQLWVKNPRQAWVLLMRNCLELSAKEVASFLDESIDNVNQMNTRGHKELKKLWRSHHEK